MRAPLRTGRDRRETPLPARGLAQPSVWWLTARTPVTRSSRTFRSRSRSGLVHSAWTAVFETAERGSNPRTGTMTCLVIHMVSECEASSIEAVTLDQTGSSPVVHPTDAPSALAGAADGPPRTRPRRSRGAADGPPRAPRGADQRRTRIVLVERILRRGASPASDSLSRTSRTGSCSSSGFSVSLIAGSGP